MRGKSDVCAGLVWVALTCGATVSWAASAQQDGQDAADGPAGLRVFLDCGRDCDRDYLRREITFIDYVRDRRDAQVHVLVTSQAAAVERSSH